MKTVLGPLAKSVLTPSGLTPAEWSADARIHKNVFGSRVATLLISNKKMDDVIKIVKSLKNLVYW